MQTEERIRHQLKLKKETYQRIRGTAKISESVLEGWINALEYVLELDGFAKAAESVRTIPPKPWKKLKEE